MILIKEIDIIEIDKKTFKLSHMKYPDDYISISNDEAIQAKIITEICKGRRFVRPDGTEIFIGISKQAQDTIGVLYDSWDELERLYASTQKNLYRMTYEKNHYKNKIYKIQNYSFWQRIKAVFFGY